MSFSLTYQTAIQLRASTGDYATAACPIVGSNKIAVVMSNSGGTQAWTDVYEGASPYTLTGSQLGLASGAAPTAATMATSNLMITHGGVGVTGAGILNVTSGSNTSYSGNAGISNRSQGLIAGQSATQFGMACTGTNGQVLVYNLGSGSVTGTYLSGLNDTSQMQTTSVAPCTINNNFLVALGNSGYGQPPLITEVNTGGQILKVMSLPPRKMVDGNGANPPRYIVNMGGFEGYLIVQTNLGEIFLVDWITGTVMQEQSVSSSNNGTDCALLTFCQDSIYQNLWFAATGNTTATGKSPILSYDYLLTPIRHLPSLNAINTGANQYIGNIGVLPGINTVYALQMGNTLPNLLHIFTYTGNRSLNLYGSVGMTDPSGSTPLYGEAIFLDNTVSPASMMFVTPVPNTAQGSTRTVPLTASLSSVIQISASANNGVNSSNGPYGVNSTFKVGEGNT